MTHSTSMRVLSIAGATGATAIAIATLSGDVIARKEYTSLALWQPVAVVALTTVAGLLMAHSRAARDWARTAGFGLLFGLGTALTVYLSVGRQHEASTSKTASLSAINAVIVAKGAEIADATKRRDKANAEAEREMTGQKCGERCNGWKARAADAQTTIDKLHADIVDLGGLQETNATASAFAKIAGLFGASNKTAVKDAAEILAPVAFSVLVELFAILGFGVGFAPRAKTPAVEAEPDAQPIEMLSPVKAWISTLHVGQKIVATQRDMAAMTGVALAVFQRALTQAALDGLVAIETTARCTSVTRLA